MARTWIRRSGIVIYLPKVNLSVIIEAGALLSCDLGALDDHQ